MTDPISLIIAGAIAGGVAGKVAESAWDSSREWLKERYGSHADVVRASARDNVADFVVSLANRVQALEKSRGLDAQRVEATEQHPAFSALLESTIINASQTADSQKHDLLASLIAERLAVDSESTTALAAAMASNAIVRCTPRQLRLLAVMCAIDEIRPKYLLSRDHFFEWLDERLRPFADDEYEEIDARHLVALACVTYDRASARDLSAALSMKSILLDELVIDFAEVPSVQALEGVWVEVLSGVLLTSVGSIVGGLAYNSITGVSIPLPDWK